MCGAWNVGRGVRDAGCEVVNQVGPEAVAPLCVGVVACGMWHVGRGISGRAAVDDRREQGWRVEGLSLIHISEPTRPY